MFSYPITTDTWLGLLTHQDVPALFALTDASRTSLREWLPWVDFTRTPSDTLNFVNAALQQLASNNGFQAGIWTRGQLAGCIGLHGIDWANRQTSIGYWLGSDFEGQGLMTRSAAAVTTLAFTHYHLNRVEIRAAIDNSKSRGIPERLGFRQEGVSKQAEWIYDHFVDHAIYAMLRGDWEQGLNT